MNARAGYLTHLSLNYLTNSIIAPMSTLIPSSQCQPWGTPYGQKNSSTHDFSRVQSPYAGTTVAAYAWPLTAVQNAPECNLRLDFPSDDELRVDSENGPQIATQADLVEVEACPMFVIEVCATECE
jgi:hypothetical protein